MGFTFFFASQIVFERLGPNPTAQRILLKTIDNKELDLLNIDSKVVIVNFWASWCTPCMVELPSLVGLQKKFDPKDLTIIGINTDEDQQLQRIHRIVKRLAISFPIVVDNGDLAEKFHINSLPYSLVLVEGKVVKIIRGAVDFTSIEMIETLKNYL